MITKLLLGSLQQKYRDAYPIRLKTAVVIRNAELIEYDTLRGHACKGRLWCISITLNQFI